MIYPFNILLTLCFSSKYRIHNNCISPSEGKFLVPRFVCVCLMVAATIYRVYRQDIHLFLDDDNGLVVLFLSFFLPISRCLTFVITFVLNIVYSHNNVLLVVLIQRIHVNIDISKSIRSFILWNWILVSTVCSVTMIAFITLGATAHFFDVLNCIVEAIFISFEIDYIYAVRVLILLIKYLDGWIKNVHMMHENNESHCLKLFVTYQNILKAFDEYKTVSQVLVRFSNKWIISHNSS